MLKIISSVQSYKETPSLCYIRYFILIKGLFLYAIFIKDIKVLGKLIFMVSEEFAIFDNKVRTIVR